MAVAHPAHAHAALHPTVRRDSYARRRPEEGVLYQAVQAHWPEVLEDLAEHGGLPKFLVREFEEYFALRDLVRRLPAPRLQQVLPRVPVRHWICSLPWGLRALLGYDRALAALVVSAFAHEFDHSLCKRAAAVLDLPSVADAHRGAIAAVQRTDSALRLSVHFHVLALDGVTVRDATNDALVFHTLPTPTHSEVADIARRTAQRIEKILQANGRSLDPAMQDGQDDQPPKLCSDEPGLAACYAAAARGVAASGDRAGQAPLRFLRTAWNFAPTASSSSLSKTFGKTAPAHSCFRPAISSSASSRLSHLRAFI